MKVIMIAALATVQLSAAAHPAQAAELPTDQAAGQQTPLEEGADLELDERRATALAVGAAPAPLRAASAQKEAQEPRKKRKSTGDKVLTGAAVVLGIGALAVGGLLVALFVG